jgi:hypothetical protein
MTTKRTSVKQQVVALLHHFAKQIQAMNDDDVERILDGDLKIEIRPADKQTKRREKPNRCSNEEMSQLNYALGKANTRERAVELIDGMLQSKTDLTRFARVIDIPVPKEASSRDLKARLVEATVGYRIRSAAIRGDACVPVDSPTNEGDSVDRAAVMP